MKPPPFQITDVDSAAAMLAAGHALSGVSRDERGRTVFEFTDSPGLQRTRMAFVNGSLRLPVAEFSRARRSLLDVVHGSA